MIFTLHYCLDDFNHVYSQSFSTDDETWFEQMTKFYYQKQQEGFNIWLV